MKRREFITLLGGGAAIWPLAARAQQPTMPVVGFMSSGSPGPLRQALAGFEDGLKEAGYIAGQNVTVEYRFTEGQADRFPALVSELVGRKVAVLAVSSKAGVQAAKQATATIPIVFSVGEDPVTIGLVASLNHPGGNLTGVYQFTTGLEGKRLGLLHELVPKATTLAVLIHPNNSPCRIAVARRARRRRSASGVQLVVVRANAESEFDAAFSTARPAESSCASGLRIPALQCQAPAACRAGGTSSVYRRYTNGASSPKQAA